MKNAVTGIILLMSSALFGQTSKDYAVLLTAEVQAGSPQITLHWPASAATSYDVFRKEKSQISFPVSPMATLGGTDSAYTDNTVDPGRSYEYYVRKNASGYAGYGYVNSGIEVPAADIRGKLVLLIDSSQATALDSEIKRLIDDLDNEGWTVLRFDVSPAAKVTEVRNLIMTEYNADPQFVKAVFILGHVPVPYSGNLSPDGHTNHVGAWPCDAYYGEMTSGWGDNIINNTSASDPRNHNVPGDGKFDHTTLPSNVELQVGRVDFANMPAFAKTETELLRAYLDKDHAYRIKEITAEPRALIDDNFGGFGGEAFASSGWKNFSVMFGPDSLQAVDYFGTLSGKSYLWSYGCGAGTHTSAGGIGTTNDFANDSLQTVFTLLFGSYFGDWDRPDNFLRAPLCQGITLASAWSGRPYWHFHHMAMGENIGYSMMQASNGGPYFSNYGARYAHIGLMGDPTLRMYIIAPPSGLVANEVNNQVALNWTASSDVVLGYYVYRKESSDELYTRITADPVPGTSFTDTDFDHTGTYYYSVRAVRLEETRSGSFYNVSTGTSAEIETMFTGTADRVVKGKIYVYPNPSAGQFMVELGEEEKITSMRLIATDGSLVWQWQPLEGTVSNLQVDIRDRKAGMYLLEVRKSDGFEVLRLIKTP